MVGKLSLHSQFTSCLILKETFLSLLDIICLGLSKNHSWTTELRTPLFAYLMFLVLVFKVLQTGSDLSVISCVVKYIR